MYNPTITLVANSNPFRGKQMYCGKDSIYLFHARSLIIAGNKGLIVHVWKETDKHVNS